MFGIFENEPKNIFEKENYFISITELWFSMWGKFL
jgi:hypothetical protein